VILREEGKSNAVPSGRRIGTNDITQNLYDILIVIFVLRTPELGKKA
jgi:hypothetical protein